MGVRAGISHFLEVVIMVGLVGVLGMLLYSGALDLFAGWGNVQQITINSVYKIGSDLNVTVANRGSTPVEVYVISIYRLDGTQLGSQNGGVIGPGKVMIFSFPNTAVAEGELVDILITTVDGATFKYRVAVQ